LAALFGFLGSDPAFARMAFVEMAMAGPRAFGVWRRASPGLGRLEPGARIAEHPVPLEAPQMIGAAIAELVRRHVVRDDVAAVTTAVPAAVYLCLVPDLGPGRPWSESQLAA
jgi:hypothetical protein